MGKFYSKVAGVTFKNPNGAQRQHIIKKHCRKGQRLLLLREPDNPHDPFAVAVFVRTLSIITLSFKKHQIGYLNNQVADEVARHLDHGHSVKATITDITGNQDDGKYLGVNILLSF